MTNKGRHNPEGGAGQDTLTKFQSLSQFFLQENYSL